MKVWFRYTSVGVPLFSEYSPNDASKTARLDDGFLMAVINGLTWTSLNGGTEQGPASSQCSRPVDRNSSRWE